MKTPEQVKEKIASKIDGKIVAAGWGKPLVFTVTTAGTYDPVTETTTGGTTTTYTYQAIPGVVDLREWQGTDVQITDRMATYTHIDAFKPSASSRCTFDGVPMQVIQAMYDAADATVKLILRGL